MPSALPVDLADGQNTSVPFMQSSDIGDNELLNATRTIETGSGYYFEITLPGGRRIESAPCGSDYPKRDAIMQWLGAIREAIVEDAANAGRAARDAQLAEPASTGTLDARAVSDNPGARAPSSDPVEYARGQLRAAAARLAELGDAEQSVANWRRVLGSLTGEGAPKKRRKRRKKKHVIQPQ